MRRFFFTSVYLFLVLIVGHIALSANLGYSDRLFTLIPKAARSNGKLGVVVKSLTTNESIFEFNADKLFIPASNQKVMISVAALSLLKPDYRFKTEFYSGGEVSAGVLYGGLYIKGYGDPTLEKDNLVFIANQLKMMGIREIRGGIIVDDSYFERTRFGKGWKSNWRGDVYSPPISALTLNHNIFEIHVSPSRPGGTPYIRLEPPGSYIQVFNKAVTSSKKGGLSAHWVDGSNAVVLNGRISPRRSSQALELAVIDPTLYTGGVFKKALEDSGIKVSGAVSKGVVPKWGNPIYTHNSIPLSMVVNEYLKESVNVIGENLIKTLGAHFKGAPGSWETGAQVISDFLVGIGVDNYFRIVDGSGLSNLNRVSPQTMTDVLQYAYTNKLIGPDFVKSLPIAGVDGTLKKRFRGSGLEGRVKAKTGYINNVRALSGYAFTRSGDVLAFSILSNGVGPQVKTFQSKILTELMDCCRSNGYRGN
jgi:D-alanyl-D-alanine carboxypeptidase/D-alanyl-D-alanine-endopeptidase (penicillin-binding protein 4)